MRLQKLALCAALLAGSTASALAQATAAATPAQAAPVQAAAVPRYLKVSAPAAQKLVLATRAAHPEIKKIGLHAVPPGETESCIIASPIVSKIGKVSSPADLTVLSTGQPKVYPHAEEGGFFDLGLPLTDEHGKNVGLMVLELSYADVSTREQALAKGLKIRDEVAARIPDKEALFAPVAP